MKLSNATYTAVSQIIESVDRKAKDIETRWGIGRLPNLVPLEWSQRFHAQQAKFTAAVNAWDLDGSTKHGAALERAYARLEELAVEAGHVPKPPEQWEFTTPDGVVVFVQDRTQAAQVELHGRKAQVWTIDEIAEVIRKHPILAAAKEAFPGATVESIRPKPNLRQELDDAIETLPF